MAIALITPFSAWLDLNLSALFFTKESISGSHFLIHPWLDFLFNYAIYPGEILASLAAVIWLLSYIMKSLRPYRSAAIVLSLSMVVGAGLIVHAILKDHWGRPRPRQIVEFGGDQPFRAYYQPNFQQPKHAKSFPCGHCSTGFYFFAMAVVGMRYRNSVLIYTGFALALTLGTLLSYARIAQGGHFLTDVIFSALIMWLTPLAIDQLLYARRQDPP